MNAHTPNTFSVRTQRVHFFCAHRVIRCSCMPHTAFEYNSRLTITRSEKRQALVNTNKKIENKKYKQKYTHPLLSNGSKRAIRLVAGCERAERIQCSFTATTTQWQKLRAKKNKSLLFVVLFLVYVRCAVA